MITASMINGVPDVPDEPSPLLNMVDINKRQQLNLARIQGDTSSVVFSVRDGYNQANLVGYSGFTLTINESSRTPEAPIFISTGDFVTSGLDGLISFPISAADSLHVGSLYYGFQAVNPSGETMTISEGVYAVLDDR